MDSISSSSKTEKEKVKELQKLNKKVTDFITTTVNRDNSARDEINKKKKDFYSKYSYLKPDCEKSKIEKIVDSLEKAADWCEEHWKLIATAVIVVVAIVLIATGVGAGIGGTLLAGACWGAITGAVIGGVAGGLESMSQGGSFWDGFEDGAFSGAIGGAAFAGLGAAGSALGKGIDCASKLGKLIKGTAAVSNILSLGMAGFDMLALADMAFDNKNNPIADLNKKLHSNKAYNIFQTGISALAVFTGGMTSTMSCFVEGTLVATLAGRCAIEKIKVGDKVLAADPDSFEKQYKKVEDVFSRKVKSLIHIIVDDEEIVTTENHPFYIKGRGFVEAGILCIGSELIDSNGKIHVINEIYREICSEEKYVYNIKVEDYHTYFVGKNELWVHNANCTPAEKYLDKTEDNGDRVYKRQLSDGKEYKVRYTKDKNGNYYPRFEDYATHPDYSDPVYPKDKGLVLTGNEQKDLAMMKQNYGKPEGYT